MTENAAWAAGFLARLIIKALCCCGIIAVLQQIAGSYSAASLCAGIVLAFVFQLIDEKVRP